MAELQAIVAIIHVKIMSPSTTIAPIKQVIEAIPRRIVRIPSFCAAGIE